MWLICNDEVLKLVCIDSGYKMCAASNDFWRSNFMCNIEKMNSNNQCDLHPINLFPLSLSLFFILPPI